MKFEIPRRTPLLRPVQGVVDGAAREALHSVIKRICEKSHISVADAVAHVLRPSFEGQRCSVRLANNSMHLISKGEGITSQWIGVLKKNVDLPDLWKYTLRDVASLNGVGVANCSHWRRWCPNCFNEDLDTDLGPYDRLLWSIEDVKVCEKHKTLLQSSCLSCGRSKIPVLTGNDISGFCPCCQSWLGGSGQVLPNGLDTHVQYLLWTAQSYSDLLDAASLPPDVSLNVLEMLGLLRDHHCNGLNINLARTLGRNKSVISTWFGGHAKPSWSALCEISFVFHIPLADLLCGDKSSIEFSQFRELPLQVAIRTKKKISEKRNVDKILLFYKSIEEAEATAVHTITDVGRRLGVPPKDLRRILPVETKALTSLLRTRREFYKAKTASFRKEAFKKEIRLLVIEMTSRAERLTRRAVHKRLRLSGLSVRRNEARFVSELVKETARSIANEIVINVSGS